MAAFDFIKWANAMGAPHLVKTKQTMTEERATLITVMKSHVNALNILLRGFVGP